MAQMITDLGNPTQITWQQDKKDVMRLPGTKLVVGILNVPREGGFTKVVSQVFPAVPGVNDPHDLPGFYQAEWFLSASNGLTIKNVRYVQAALPDQIHNVVEFMQWSHLRLIFDKAPIKFPDLEFSVSETSCTDAYLITFPGVRADGKIFAWAAGASFTVRVPDPRVPTTIYTVSINQSYLFTAPAADIEPSANVVAVKGVPVLTVSVASSDPAGLPPPSFAADLKMVFAPQLTRPDQHRPAAQFISSNRLNTNVASLFCDTNERSRGIPGQGTPPNKPFWDRVFDYAEPDIRNEIVFDAVVFPRSKASTNPYIVARFPSTQLKCQREGGQGEFDNIHIHPWVGFDDPASAGGTSLANHPALVEAPIAADEVIHLHWRWGVTVPEGVKDDNLPTPEDAERLRRGFRGYDEKGNLANSLPGAPLIPSNQSLRIKVADPLHDVSDPTGGPLNAGATAVWYSPTFHTQKNGEYTQFCGHGFALAYRLKELIPKPLPLQTNADLLDDPHFPFFSYHDLRWDGSGKQKIPTASATTVQPAGLSRNRTGIGPIVDEGLFTFT